VRAWSALPKLLELGAKLLAFAFFGIENFLIINQLQCLNNMGLCASSQTLPPNPANYPPLGRDAARVFGDVMTHTRAYVTMPLSLVTALCAALLDRDGNGKIDTSEVS
jgi:hypothetical protein